MKILYLEWKSFCNEDMWEAFVKKGYTVDKFPFDNRKQDIDPLFEKLNIQCRETSYEFFFSFNYFPIISRWCNEHEIKYVSWVYDSPYIHLYSYTVPYKCNYIFVFDFAVYDEFRNQNINTIYYMPLAISNSRLSHIRNTISMKKKHECDIAFVESMYSEEKHQLYKKFASVNDFTKGYLDGIIQAQLGIYGYNFLQEVLDESIIEEMQRVYPVNPNDTTIATPEYIYAEYVLARQVTTIERQQILEIVSQVYHTNLYTYNENLQIDNINNMGKIDYYDEMPFVFMNAKINLNISLKSIRTGIPLRAWDIMGCGGFLLTNYQEEFHEYFIPDKDFVYYSDYEDLMEKIQFYISHDDERGRIAASGCEKVRKGHTYEKRISEILEIIQEHE